MDEYLPDPRLVVAAVCPRPRCGAPGVAGTAAVSIGSCGHQWQVCPTEVPGGRAGPPDLYATAQSLDRLRQYVCGAG